MLRQQLHIWSKKLIESKEYKNVAFFIKYNIFINKFIKLKLRVSEEQSQVRRQRMLKKVDR